MNGRKTSELIREMDDIIQTEKLHPTSLSLILSIEYSKALDIINAATIIEAPNRLSSSEGFFKIAR